MARDMEIGSTVRFKEGRNGTFDPATTLEIKEFIGAWVVAQAGRQEHFLMAERLEVVDHVVPSAG